MVSISLIELEQARFIGTLTFYRKYYVYLFRYIVNMPLNIYALPRAFSGKINVMIIFFFFLVFNFQTHYSFNLFEFN